MHLFAEHASLALFANAGPTVAKPLPRLTAVPKSDHSSPEKYEVLVVGGGPAGLLLNLLLARYGLSDSSRLCIDARSSTVKSGHADGLHSRSLEVLKSLDLVDEILNHGKHTHEFSSWHKDPEAPERGPMRQFVIPMPFRKGRYPPQLIAIHQGWIERIFEEDLRQYSINGVERNSRLIDVRIAGESDVNFPIVATIEHAGKQRLVRAKYLIGADGAHSAVRRSLGISMEGSMEDDIWGVVDIVADTDFPDVRRVTHINADGATMLLIPRERNAQGQYLTRLYVPFKPDAASNGSAIPETPSNQKLKIEERQRTRKAQVSIDSILQRASEILKPYFIRPKEGTQVEWWTAYQVGQRVAQRLVEKDSKGDARVFLIGDACHTHSPSQGQGMNVSMMDAYDLSWKLMYALHGLTPDPQALFETFSHDRHENALNLIDTDRRWYKSRYKDNGDTAKMSEDFIRAETGAFISGVGIEYDSGFLVDEKSGSEKEGPIISSDFASGVLREGRRLADVVVTRFADGVPSHTQDDFPSDGRFRILALASADLLSADGISAAALTRLCQAVIPSFVSGVVELVVINPLPLHSFEWTQIPACVKGAAEMRFHCADAEGYAAYGVDPDRGALAVVRPDGYVGTIAHLSNVKKVEEYLRRCLYTAS